MALILAIETATSICSVALGKDGILLEKKELNTQNSHSSQLTVLIEDLLKSQNLKVADLSAIAISKGPGSYTGLRIGTSVAKGLCYACSLPLIAIETLESLTLSAINKLGFDDNNTNCLFAPFIDARRMEVYSALYKNDLSLIKEVHPLIIDEYTFNDIKEDNTIYIFGNGAEKCKDTLIHPNIKFINEVELSAEFMIPLAEKYFNNNNFVDVAYFEPSYLKEFQATTPKKNVLG